MAEAPIIAVDSEENAPKDPNPINDDHARSSNTGKRKRKLTSSPENLSADEKEARIEALTEELVALFGYYNEVKNEKVGAELNQCGSRNAVIAVLMEESELPLSSLVDEICDKLKNVGNGVVPVEPVTPPSVKSSVLSVGQRIAYGVPNADADVLEDHSESCFWCWETRDVKLIPESVRGLFVIRRICRKRIHERIVAVSEMISSLKKPESEQNYNHGLIKASAKLGKAYSEADIRILVDGLLQKNSVDMNQKKAEREEKLLLKQLDNSRREVEKGNKSMDNVLLSEKDLKLFQGGTGKDEKSYEKDVCEKRKQTKKQPEETKKDQRRREKEESELKKKHSLQKQASIMERFLRRGKTSNSFQNDQFLTELFACDSSIRKSENVHTSATLSMDCTLASSSGVTLEDIRKSQFSLWKSLGKSICSNRKQGWGLRRKPKSEPFKELKLAATTGVAYYDDLAVEKHVDGLGEHSSDIRSFPKNRESTILDAKKCQLRKQLLQFDNSPRPAYYGIWSKRSQIIGPRHPFKKEPSLDYDVNSDEEWEEEGSSESLSDNDTDDEESSKSDGESEDGFLVPGGYLSEDEGPQVAKLETVTAIEGAESSTGGKDDVESEELCALLQQQKIVKNLTEHALNNNQPLIIPNLLHDKELCQNFSGTLKLEQMCLQSLSMRIISTSSCIEISADQMQDKVQDSCSSTGKGGSAPISDVDAMLDSNLSFIVATIQTCPQGINSVLESLQKEFPSASKSLLRNKVREVSDYVDNCLQVKKEVLVKLGLAPCPEKSCMESGSIAAFFSRSCLPTARESEKPGETSLLSPPKSGFLFMDESKVVLIIFNVLNVLICFALDAKVPTFLQVSD